MIYFDNAATTYYKPPCVINAVTDAINKFSVNAHRGTSNVAGILEEKLRQTRILACAVAGHNNATAVFSQNCTSALNLAIFGTARRGGHVITTACEHNSVLRPLFQLKKQGLVDVTVIYPNEEGEITPYQLAVAIQSNTYMVVLNHVSNVTGKMQDVGKLAHTVKRINPNLLVLCDCAQSVGYVMLNMEQDGIDYLAFPTHKGLHGIQGCGVLIFDTNKAPRPVVFGGTGTESNNPFQPTSLPESLESGTLNTPAILAANAAFSWWANNFVKGSSYLCSLQKRLLDGLMQIDGVKVYSQPNASGIVAFNLKQFDSGAVGDALSARYDVSTRTGLHCAPLMHKYLGTLNTGVVRASLSVSNTEKEVDFFLDAVTRLSKSNTI